MGFQRSTKPAISKLLPLLNTSARYLGFRQKKPFQALTEPEKKKALAEFRRSAVHPYSEFSLLRERDDSIVPDAWGVFTGFSSRIVLLDDRYDKAIATFDIDWEKSDKDIANEFREWISEYRPSGTSQNKRGIKLNSLRVFLDRLAVMRLLHRYAPREIRKNMPDVWQRYFQREYFKERKRAAEVFYQLFPEERDTGLRPSSWSTKSERSK